MTIPPQRSDPASTRPPADAGPGPGRTATHGPAPADRPRDRFETLARRGTPLRAEQTAAVVARYVEDGMPIRAVAADLGLSYGKVYDLLVESDTPRRPVGNTTHHATGNTRPAAAVAATDRRPASATGSAPARRLARRGNHVGRSAGRAGGAGTSTAAAPASQRPADPEAWDRTVAAATAVVDELGSAGEHAAGRLLAGLLGTLDPATALPDHRVIAAATLYVRVADVDRVSDDVAWARYAYHAARALHGPNHPATLPAAEAFASALYTRGRFTDAATVRRHLIQVHLDRSDIDAHLHARVELALTLHAAGRCTDAVKEARAAWTAWTQHHDAADPRSIIIVVSVAGMLLACGHHDEGLELLGQLPEPPEPGQPAYNAYVQFATTSVAAWVQHRPVCAHNPDRRRPQATTRGTARGTR